MRVRVGQRHAHAQVVLGGPVLGGQQQRGRPLVADGDELAQHRGAALARPLLRALPQRGPDSLPAGVGVHVDRRVVAEQLAAGHELAARRLDDPGVAREVDAGRRPVGPHVLEREVGLADVGDVAREDHAQDRVGVGLRARRADDVFVRQRGVHGREPTRGRGRRRSGQADPGCGNWVRMRASQAASGSSACCASIALADGVTV